MKKIHIPLPCPERQDLVTIREKTADMARLTKGGLRSAKRRLGRILVRAGTSLYLDKTTCEGDSCNK